MYDWDISKLRFIDDLHALSMAERYNLADAHTVLSHREGWSLPLTEAMACGVVNLAMDWCSGTEICGDGKGVITKPLDYVTVSTWGNALDYHPDIQDFADKLTWLADHPTDRNRIASNGQAWAQTLSWDTTAHQIADILRAIK
jgi:glycosyltransferase involved in cell wall biosynthesis